MNIVIWKEYITAILSYILLNLKPSLKKEEKGEEEKKSSNLFKFTDKSH